MRTANAFAVDTVHIVGRKRWNRRGAMVTDRYQHVRHHPSVEDFVQWAQQEGLPVIGVDLFPESVPLETYDLAAIGVEADKVGLSVAWTQVEETTERPPRTQGEIVKDEDGSGAQALTDFLASKKFI